MNLRGWGLVAIALSTATACENHDAVLGVSLEPPAGRVVTYSDDISPIFRTSCAVSGCHDSFTQESQQDLTRPFDPVVGAVGVPSVQAIGLNRIEPGSSSTSYLVLKLLGTQGLVGGFGDRMPLGSASLSKEQITLIRRWIDDGAKNN